MGSSTGAAVVPGAVTVAATRMLGDETAPTEMPEEASARLRFSAVAAAATPAALSFGTCGATRAVSRPHPPSRACKAARRGCKALQRGVREVAERHGTAERVGALP